MSVKGRLLKLEQLESCKQYKHPDHTSWVIEVVEKNEHGEIVVVGRHWHFKEDKQYGFKNQ